MSDIDRAAQAALWYKDLCNTSNSLFLPLYFDKHRYLVLKGGGGSGKSIFDGRKILERAVGEGGHRFLVCRKVARTLRESCFKQLCSQLAEHFRDFDYKINKSDMVITIGTSEIIFAGLDDVEKLKSIYNITGIWIEEASEISEADFNQLDIRLRGETEFYKQIILTFNPISIQHWLKKRFFDLKDERTRTHESTYRDNSIDVTDESENEPEAKGSSDTSEDMVTLYTAYYRNDKGGIGIYSWCNDTEICDIEDYQARRLKKCKKCGATAPPDAEYTGEHCYYCTGVKRS